MRNGVFASQAGSIMKSQFASTISKGLGGFFAAAMLVAASPALANSSSNSAAAADVTEPVREAQDEGLANGDERFSELFASWSAIDSAPVDASGVEPLIAERATVSIPSRMPL